MASEEGGGDRERADEALERLEERVQHVRHLHPFEVSMREDGRFTCELSRPISTLTLEEVRMVARALEDLAEAVRESAGV